MFKCKAYKCTSLHYFRRFIRVRSHKIPPGSYCHHSRARLKQGGVKRFARLIEAHGAAAISAHRCTIVDVDNGKKAAKGARCDFSTLAYTSLIYTSSAWDRKGRTTGLGTMAQDGRPYRDATWNIDGSSHTLLIRFKAIWRTVLILTGRKPESDTR